MRRGVCAAGLCVVVVGLVLGVGLSAYVPAKDDDEQRYCEAAGISFGSLVLPDTSLPDLRLKFETPLIDVATELLDILLRADLRANIGTSAPKILLKVPVIAWALGIVCIIVLLLILLCVACCLGCFKAPKTPELDGGVQARLQDLPSPNGMEMQGVGSPNVQRPGMPNFGGRYPDQQSGAVLLGSDEEDDRVDRAADEETRRRREAEDFEQTRAEAEKRRIREWQKGAQLNPQEEYQLEEEHRRAREQVRRRREEDDNATRKQREERNHSKKQNNNQKDQKNDQGRKNDSGSSSPDEAKSKSKDLQKYLKIQKVFQYSSYGAGASAVGLTIAWLVYLARAVSNLKTVACGAAGFKRIALHGDISGTYKFAGVNGLKFITTSALSLTSKLPAISVSANLNNINARGFSTEAPKVWTAFGQLDRVEANYAYLGIDGQVNVNPPSISDYLKNILPGTLRTEVFFLTTLGINIGKAGVIFGKVPAIDTTMINNFNMGLDLSLGTLGTGFLKIFTSSVPDYFGIFKDYAWVAMILGGILIFTSLIIAAYVLYYLAKILAIFRREDDEQKEKDGNYDKLDDQFNRDPEAPNWQNQGSGDPQRRDNNQNPGQRQNQGQNQNRNLNQPREQNQQQRDNQDRQRQDGERQNDNSREEVLQNKDQPYNSFQEQQKKPTAPEVPKLLKCCTCLAKAFTLGGMKVCQLVLGLGIGVIALIMLVVAVASFVGSVAVTTGCLVGHQALVQADFAIRLANSGLLNKQASAFVTECLALNGTGDLSKIMDVPQNDLFDMINGAGGLAAYESQRSSLFDNTTVVEPQVGASVQTRWVNLASLKTSDSDGNGNDLEAGRKQILNNKCSSDSMGYNDGTCTSSSPSDSDTQGLGTNFCFNLGSFQSKGYPNRYNTGVTCSGNPNTSSAQSTLTNTLAAAGRYKNALGKMQVGFANPFYLGSSGTQGEKGLFVNLKAASGDIKAVANEPNIKAFVDVQATFGGGLEASGNCTLLRNGIIATQNAVCDKVYTQLYTQSKLSFANALTLLGTALTIFGSCFYTTKIELLTSM